jgi:hypothetical protein
MVEPFDFGVDEERLKNTVLIGETFPAVSSEVL